MSKSSWRLTEGDDIAAGLLAMSRLGGGHAYEAYLAWSEPLHAHVVVKVIRPEQVDDSRTLRGLRREVAMLKRLQHPVIVRSFGAQPEGVRPHVILEHLDGPRLSTLLRRYGPLPMEQLLPLALQICSALHYLAGQGGGAPRRQAKQHHHGFLAAHDRLQHRPDGRGGGSPRPRRGHRRLPFPRAVRSPRVGHPRNGI
jgi:serine/threonine protein kinase